MFKLGLVFGKFMPVHNGHLALIEFAKRQCEQIIVSMSYTEIDPISQELRFQWLQNIYLNDKNIILVKHLDDFNDESLNIFDSTKLWANFINKQFPEIDAFFCSEDYGEPLSYHLKLPNIVFDKSRRIFPVSATKIRLNPFKYWDFIPGEVKPYFVKKICIYGPESVGKSVLTIELANIFQTNFVHEVARDFLFDNHNIDTDLITKIAKTHSEFIFESLKSSNKLLFCDTDIITTQIYANHYLGYIPEVLFELEKKTQYDLYLLLNIDVPWVYDPLRDLKNKRDEMYLIFKNELIVRKIKFIEINGSWDVRKQIAVSSINHLLI